MTAVQKCRRCGAFAENPIIVHDMVPGKRKGTKGKQVEQEFPLCIDCEELRMKDKQQFWMTGWDFEDKSRK